MARVTLCRVPHTTFIFFNPIWRDATTSKWNRVIWGEYPHKTVYVLVNVGVYNLFSKQKGLIQEASDERSHPTSRRLRSHNSPTAKLAANHRQDDDASLVSHRRVRQPFHRTVCYDGSSKEVPQGHLLLQENGEGLHDLRQEVQHGE